MDRRKFLKLLLIGGGVILLGKIFGSGLNFFSDFQKKKEKNFQNFRAAEEGNEIIFYDQKGEKIFIIEKDSF